MRKLLPVIALLCVITSCEKEKKTVQVESLKLEPSELSLTEGEVSELSVTILPEDATDKTIYWESSDPTTVTVEDGKVTAVAPGKADIIASAAGGTVTGKCVVTVTPKHVSVESVTLDIESAELSVDETLTLNATLLPENATDKSVVWTSADESVATVNDKGKVTAVAAGETEITVQTNDGAKTAKCAVKVVKIKLDLVDVPAGEFLMGSSDGSNIGNADGSGLNTTEAEEKRFATEHQHKVIMSEFKISKYEITNQQFCNFLNDNGIGESGTWDSAPSYPGERMVYDSRNVMSGSYNWGVNWDNVEQMWVPAPVKENHPVIFVTWYGAAEFAAWAGAQLPTEAQFEYAVRAGSSEMFSFGDDISLLGNYSWYMENSEDETHEVGTKEPNAFGLYDMAGNVAEWCRDWFSPTFGMTDYTEVLTDPVGPDTGTMKMWKCGSYSHPWNSLRSAVRNSSKPGDKNKFIGFRIVVE